MIILLMQPLPRRSWGVYCLPCDLSSVELEGRIGFLQSQLSGVLHGGSRLTLEACFKNCVFEQYARIRGYRDVGAYVDLLLWWEAYKHEVGR